MNENKLNRLKEVLSVPTVSRNETLMIEYLKKVLTEKNYEHTVDQHGNIYVTKGKAEFYPCFVSHTDTVHSIDHGLTVLETKDGDVTILTGINKDTGNPSGIGGDDKCGVFLCLEMLDTLDNVKAAFFVSEEIGCLGSKHADPKFFENVGYAIQYDSPEGDSMSFTLMGKELFGKSSEFGGKVTDLILEHGVDKWAYHPYTDVWQLIEKFNFSCLNLAAGYYNMHTSREYVIVEDVDNAFELGLKIVKSLGENKYDRPTNNKNNEPWWKRNGGVSSRYENPKPLIVEDVSDELDGIDFDVDVDFIDLDETKIIRSGTKEWDDLFDYNDFNGGQSIINYGTRDDYGFDW